MIYIITMNEVMINGNLCTIGSSVYNIRQDKNFILNKYYVKYQNPNSYINIEFENEKDFINCYSEMIENNIQGRFFHEKIDIYSVKLFFDIDIKYEKDNQEYLDKYFNIPNDKLEKIIIKLILDVLRPLIHENLEFYLKYIISSHHRYDKKSFRIIFPNLYFENIQDEKIFILNKFEEFLNIIDIGIYKHGQCRLIESSKRGIEGAFNIKEKIKFDENFLINCNENYEGFLFINDVVDTVNTTEEYFLEGREKISFIDMDKLIELDYPEIYQDYILKPVKNNPNSFRLNNRGNAKCVISNKFTHKKDNARIYITTTVTDIYINAWCYNNDCCSYNYDCLPGKKELKRIKYNYTPKYDDKKFYDSLLHFNNKNSKPELNFDGYKRFYTENKYLDINEIKPYLKSLLYLSLPCGKGKTTIATKAIIQLINEYTNLKKINNLFVIIVSCRRTLTFGIEQDFNETLKKYGMKERFENYLITSEKLIKEFKSNFRIISPESIHKLCKDLTGEGNEKKEIYLINEEFPHLISQFNNKNTHGDELINNKSTFVELNKKAFGILCMSGTPDRITNGYIKDITNLPPISYDFMVKSPVKNLTVYNDGKIGEINMINTLYEKIQNKEFPIGIGWYRGVNSQNHKVSKLDKFEKKLKIFFPDSRIKIINSKTDSVELELFGRNPDEYLQEVDIFIYTSSAYIGVDIQTKFKSCFIFCNYLCANDPTGIIQMLWRLRQCLDNYIVMSRFNSFIKTDKQELKTAVINFTDATKSGDLNKIEHKINYKELKKISSQFDDIVNANNFRIIFLRNNFCEEFNKYAYNNRISLIFDIDHRDLKDIPLLVDEKKSKKINTDLIKEKIYNFTLELNNIELININDYEILQRKHDKDLNDYNKIRKYNIYKNGYTGILTEDTVKCYYANSNEIYNLNILSNFTIQEIINDDSKETLDKLKIIDDIINGEQYENCIMSVEAKNRIKNNLMNIFNCNTATHINSDDREQKAKDKIINNISYKIRDVEEVLKQDDISLHELLTPLRSNKFRAYIALKCLYLFNLPILESKCYERKEFIELCKTIHKIYLINFYENEKMWSAYLIYLGYGKGAIKLLSNKTLVIVEKNSKILIEFIRKIISPFGMRLRIIEDKNKTKKHKYIFELKTIIKNNISVFQQEGKIPIINYKWVNAPIINEETKKNYEKLNELINIIPLKKSKKNKSKKSKTNKKTLNID